mgnify:CR=1 FL=1
MNVEPNSLEYRLCIFAYLRANLLHNLTTVYSAEGNEGGYDEDIIKEELLFFNPAYRILINDLGIPDLHEKELKQILVQSEGDDENIFRRFVKVLMYDDKNIENIIDKFGDVNLKSYKLVTVMTYVLLFLPLVLAYFEDENHDEVEQDIADGAGQIIGSFVGYLIAIKTVIREEVKDGLLVGRSMAFIRLADKIEDHLENDRHDDLEDLQSQLYDALSVLIPTLSFSHNHISTYNKFLDRLIECKPGREDWMKYESVVEDILKFSFAPPFSNVYSQVRTSDGFERRDLIIPNTLYNGLWLHLHNSYDCSNIVFEVKNKEGKFVKDNVNQLRVYLMKPTIGRFGMLVLRRKSSDLLEKAIKQAYDQSRILILMVDDNDLQCFMLYKMIFASPEKYIQQMKINFELLY